MAGYDTYNESCTHIIASIKAGDGENPVIHDTWKNPLLPTPQEIYKQFGNELTQTIRAWQFTRRTIGKDAPERQVMGGTKIARERVELYEVEFYSTYRDGSESFGAEPTEREFQKTIDRVIDQFYTIRHKEFTIRNRAEVTNVMALEIYDMYIHEEVHCHYAKIQVEVTFHNYINKEQ